MHFFDPERSKNDLSSPTRLWLFFAISGPVSIVAVISWVVWRKWKASVRRREKREIRDRMKGHGEKESTVVVTEKLGEITRAPSYLARPGQNTSETSIKDFAPTELNGKKRRVGLTQSSPPEA
jgi:hypothetical protein